MKNIVMFIVSLFVLAFLSDTSAHGREISAKGSVSILNDVEILGPYIVDVDYAMPFSVLIDMVPYNRQPEIDFAFVTDWNSWLEKYRHLGKVRREIYLVHTNIKSDETFLVALEKKMPGLKPAGPYELFNFSAVHGKAFGKSTYFSVKSEIISSKPGEINRNENVKWSRFQTRYYHKEGQKDEVDIIASHYDKEVPMYLNDFTLFMR